MPDEIQEEQVATTTDFDSLSEADRDSIVLRALLRLADSLNVRSSREHLRKVLYEIRRRQQHLDDRLRDRLLDMIGSSMDVGLEHVKRDFERVPEEGAGFPEDWGNGAGWEWNEEIEGGAWTDYKALLEARLPRFAPGRITAGKIHGYIPYADDQIRVLITCLRRLVPTSKAPDALEERLDQWSETLSFKTRHGFVNILNDVLQELDDLAPVGMYFGQSKQRPRAIGFWPEDQSAEWDGRTDWPPAMLDGVVMIEDSDIPDRQNEDRSAEVGASIKLG